MNSIEIFDGNQQYAPAQTVKVGENTYIREDLVNKQIEELKKQLKDTENLAYELQTKLNLKEHEPVFCNLAGRDCDCLGQVEELKQQLKGTEQLRQEALEEGIKCGERDRDKILELQRQLEEKDKEIESLRKKAFIDMTEKEILELKLHTQPKEIVEKIKLFLNSKSNKVPDKDGWFDPIRKGMSLNEYLDEILKEYEGGE